MPGPRSNGNANNLNGSTVPRVTPGNRTPVVTVIGRDVKLRRHLLSWIIGVVVASLVSIVPLIFHGIDNRTMPSIYDLLGHGDLLLASVILTIAGIAEIAPILSMGEINASEGGVAVFLLVGGTLVIVGEATWYADLVSEALANKSSNYTPPMHSITYGSVSLFLVSALCSTLCLKIAVSGR